MRIMIDIPEREYKVICENNYVAVCACPNLLSNAIKNGTPIPDNVPTVDVLEKIRTEIYQLHCHPKLDFIKTDDVVDMALDIIDKYR